MIRSPKTVSNHPTIGSKRPTGADVLEAEMMGEQAYALGLAGKKLERALLEYSRSNRDPRRTQNAVNAVYDFFIQREMIVMTNHDYVIEFYDIPNVILARVGAKNNDA